MLGGRLLADGGAIDGLPAAEWISRTLAELAALPEGRLMTRATLFSIYDGIYGAIERANDQVAQPPEHQVRQRLWWIVAKRSIVAAGAIERPIVFPGNDTPGVMTASAVRTYVERYAATPATSPAPNSAARRPPPISAWEKCCRRRRIISAASWPGARR